MARGAVAVAIVITLAACVNPAPTEPTRQAAPSFQALTPGVPGTPDCRGQTERFAAQGDGGLADTKGVAALASFAGLSLPALNAFIEQYCAGA